MGVSLGSWNVLCWEQECGSCPDRYSVYASMNVIRRQVAEGLNSKPSMSLSGGCSGPLTSFRQKELMSSRTY